MILSRYQTDTKRTFPRPASSAVRRVTVRFLRHEKPASFSSGDGQADPPHRHKNLSPDKHPLALDDPTLLRLPRIPPREKMDVCVFDHLSSSPCLPAESFPLTP